MRVRVLKRGERFYPQKKNMLGFWTYFEEDLDPNFSQTLSFESAEKAMAFLKSTNASDEVVFEGEI